MHPQQKDRMLPAVPASMTRSCQPKAQDRHHDADDRTFHSLLLAMQWRQLPAIERCFLRLKARARLLDEGDVNRRALEDPPRTEFVAPSLFFFQLTRSFFQPASARMEGRRTASTRRCRGGRRAVGAMMIVTGLGLIGHDRYRTVSHRSCQACSFVSLRGILSQTNVVSHAPIWRMLLVWGAIL